jgi:hypothetical protein
MTKSIVYSIDLGSALRTQYSAKFENVIWYKVLHILTSEHPHLALRRSFSEPPFRGMESD